MVTSLVRYHDVNLSISTVNPHDVVVSAAFVCQIYPHAGEKAVSES
jgi:hypothetical protein